MNFQQKINQGAQQLDIMANMVLYGQPSNPNRPPVNNAQAQAPIIYNIAPPVKQPITQAPAQTAMPEIMQPKAASQDFSKLLLFGGIAFVGFIAIKTLSKKYSK